MVKYGIANAEKLKLMDSETMGRWSYNSLNENLF